MIEEDSEFFNYENNQNNAETNEYEDMNSGVMRQNQTN